MNRRDVDELIGRLRVASVGVIYPRGLDLGQLVPARLLFASVRVCISRGAAVEPCCA